MTFKEWNSLQPGDQIICNTTIDTAFIYIKEREMLTIVSIDPFTRFIRVKEYPGEFAVSLYYNKYYKHPSRLDLVD